MRKKKTFCQFIIKCTYDVVSVELAVADDLFFLVKTGDASKPGAQQPSSSSSSTSESGNNNSQSAPGSPPPPAVSTNEQPATAAGQSPRSPLIGLKLIGRAEKRLSPSAVGRPL